MSAMRFDTSPRGRLVHTHRHIPVWGELDALGHMNNTRYFAWCEEARIAWLATMGEIDYLSGKSEMGPVVINAACTFLKQLFYPCELSVKVYTDEVGRSSFVTRYEILNDATGEVHATGAAKIVWVDYGKEKSVPLPEKIRTAVERALKTD